MKNALLTRTHRRGAATVELAILMIVLVPTVLYMIFLQDVLWARLQMQEAVGSSPIDFLPIDWNKPGDKPTGLHQRHTYCDHTSAYDSYDIQFECRDERHHANFAAHECWLTETGIEENDQALQSIDQADQVRCQVEKDRLLENETLRGTKMFYDVHNQGGIVTCAGRLGVTNYFLVNEFLQSWAGNVEMTKLRKFEKGGSVHGDAKTLKYLSEAIIFPVLKMSMLHDPWAVNELKETKPDDFPQAGNPIPLGYFYDYSKTYYENQKGQSEAGVTEAGEWGEARVKQEVLSTDAMRDNPGDSLDTMPLAWNVTPKREFGDFPVSGWNDERHEETYDARSNNGSRPNTYFGMPPGYY